MRVSLAQTGKWVFDRGAVPQAALKDVATEFTQADIDRWSIESDAPVGRLRRLGPTVAPLLDAALLGPPSVPLGYNQPAWPARTPV